MCRYVFVRITEDNALTYTNPPCSLECWEEIQGWALGGTSHLLDGPRWNV
jgi:hypothetical protein